jgi:hypothetical protein
MGWYEEAGHEAGNVPPRPRLGLPRDKRLAGFAKGGEWDTCPPSAELTDVLESVSGSDWECPGATDDELVGIARRWAAIESWAGAAKLGAIRALIRNEDESPTPAGQRAGRPDAWSEALTHELALALAASTGAADRTAWLAVELGTRLPGIGALLADGTLSYLKARAVAEAFQHLSDGHAAQAEALILGRLAGRTHMQVVRLAATAAGRVDPDGDERRRKTAEKEAARVQLWREQSGTVALAGFGLPTDEALAAHVNVCARAERYKESGAFRGAQMDQLRAMGYLDLLNGVTTEERITRARARSADPAATAGGDDNGPDDTGQQDGGTPGESGPGGGSGGSGGGGSGSRANSGKPADLSHTDLVVPLITLLGLGNRPGEAHRLGPLDPALCRDLAAIAVNSLATRLCLTVTDADGIAIGHGCARPHGGARERRQDANTALTALPARLNLTIPLTDLRGNTGPASRGSPWAFTREAGDTGPPGGYGTWTLAVPDGREFTVRLEQVPTFTCDHAHESHAYQPNDTLRHLVQVRDGDCTFPPCTRHARESDFEHAVPYDKGGRTCACNAGARSRKCHRIKQSPGWTVTQPEPGFHEWTTPAGRTYTQEPKRYPA